MRALLFFLLTVVIVSGTIFSQGKRGSRSEAEALVKKAVSFYNTNGQVKAFSQFNDPNGKFVQGDLYIFVYDFNGKCVAHGGNPKMIGKDLIDLKDSDGKSFVKERLEIAKTKGKGWQNYKFTNPVSKSIEDKTAYLEKADNYVIGCGAYCQK